MGEQKVDLQNEFYCFISYKHKKDGRFEKDQSWAEKLEGSFHRTQIKVPPVAERTIIHGSSDDSNEYIGKVYRDFTNLSGGYYTEEIQSGLRCSRKLVSIVSDEMLADQNKIVKQAKQNGNVDIYNEAWCYKEIRDFLSFPNHTLDDVILVYIGEKTEFSLDLVPSPLLNRDTISNIKPVFKDSDKDEVFRAMTASEQQKYLNNYWHDRNAIFVYAEGEKAGLADLVAAKIACNIFGLKGEGAQAFISFRKLQLDEEKAKEEAHRAKEDKLLADAETEKERRKRLFWTAALITVILAVTGFFMWQRGQVLSAYRYLEQAKVAFAELNIPKATDLSLQAEKAGGTLPEIKEFQRKVFANDYTKPVQIIRKKSLIKDSRENYWEIDYDKENLTLISGPHQGETIVLPNDYIPYGFYFSVDGGELAIPGYDSIYVYNRSKKCFDFSTPYNGGWSSNVGEIYFSPSNEHMLRCWKDSVLVHPLIDRGEAISIHEQYDGFAANESEILAVGHISDSLSLYQFTNKEMGFHRIYSWPLLSDFQNVICNPNLHTIITFSKDTISYYAPERSHIIQVVTGKDEPLIATDKDSDRFVTVTTPNESNGYRKAEIRLWKNGLCIARKFLSSMVQCISLGKNDDVLFCSDGRVYIWRYSIDETFTLDASDCVLSEFVSNLQIFANEHYIRLEGENYLRPIESESGTTENFYASFLYPDFSMLKVNNYQDKWPLCNETLFAQQTYMGNNSYLVRVFNATDETLVWEKHSGSSPSYKNDYIIMGDTIYASKDGHQLLTMPLGRTTHYEILTKEDRAVFFGKDSFMVYSLANGSLIKECLYPFSESIDVVETDSFGNGYLFADLRHFSNSDIGSMKGHSWLMSIDLNGGEIVHYIKREGFFYLNDNGENLILSAENGDIQIFDEQLHMVNALNIGEFVAGKPQRAVDGYYYVSSNDGNLYRCSFKNTRVKKVDLPYRSESFNGRLLAGRYYQILTEDNNSKARFLYDLIEKRIVLYMLPEETIECVENGTAVIKYRGRIPNLVLQYKRSLLSDSELSSMLRQSRYE